MRRETFYNNNKSSIPMEDMIKDINSFEEFERRFSEEFLDEDAQLADWLRELVFKYDKDFATVSRKAGLDKSYLGNLVRGVKKNPRRDALIAICLELGTTVEEVQYLLKYAGHSPLYVRRKRDVIIWFGFMKHKDRGAVDDDLYNYGFKTLSKAE